MFKNVLIIGASRGLGRAVARFASVHLACIEALTLVSRKKEGLEETRRLVTQADVNLGTGAFKADHVSTYALDMTNEEGRRQTVQLIEKNNYDLIIYAAGGGPHGVFSEKELKDHLWALNVGLIAPMTLVHTWLKSRAPGCFVVVGSRIAESSPDTLASSYAASKHGLKGFVSSIQKELEGRNNKVWLFSPGYLDSQMLPATAKVRHDGSKLMSVETAAQALLRWVKTDGPWHRVLS